MKKIKNLLLVLPFVLVVFACNDWISDVDPLIDRVQDELLTSESQTNFVIRGVQQRFSTVASQLAMQTDLLADAMIYTSDIASASFPSFEEMDKGAIQIQNATSTATYRQLGELRFFADNLVKRASAITYTDQALKNSALFNGNLYGGIARFYSATSFGLTENQPGGIIDAGPFIAAPAFLDDAIAKYNEAIKYTTDVKQIRIVNSLIAKAYLAKADYAKAATAAAAGMISGDADFQALNSDVSNIYFWGFAGAGRVQAGVANRFNDYIKADAKEANRIKIKSVTGTSKTVYYYQDKYPLQASPFPVMTWKENNLMIAECVLRGSGSGNALALVNAVRAAYSIDPLTSINTTSILVERDKELFVQGTRLMDQNRTNTFHLPAGSWRYLPIPQTERDANPNLPK